MFVGRPFRCDGAYGCLLVAAEVTLGGARLLADTPVLPVKSHVSGRVL